MVLFSEQEDIQLNSLLFEDVSSIRKAPVWEYFHLNQAEKIARCQFPDCGKIYYIKNGMKGLLLHLKAKHDIDLKTIKSTMINSSEFLKRNKI